VLMEPEIRDSGSEEPAHIDRCYELHGIRLAVSFDRPALAAALDARLRQFTAGEEREPDLIFQFFCVPDDGPHRITRPAGRGRRISEPKAGEIVYFDESDQIYLDSGDRVRLLCEPGRGRTSASIRESEAENLWFISHPLFTLPLIESLKRRGRFSVHAAGLGREGRVLLLPGDSGSGKSTLTVALVRAGFGFLSDDTVFLARGPEGLRVLAFPDEIDVTDETAGFFPELRHLPALPGAGGWTKRQVWPERVWGAEIVGDGPPAVLVFPRIAHKDQSTVTPLDRGEALLELASNVFLTEPRSSQEHLDVLAELVRERGCYRLETGRDLERVPELLRELVSASGD
jgi:hypothetical protein